MKVLITGATGQVGHELVRMAPSGYQLFMPGRDELDITRPEQVASTFQQSLPDICINAAAYTAVDRAEHEPAQAHDVNATAVRHLAEMAAKTGTVMFHLSTDYVFSGEGDTPWHVDDEPLPLSVYGASKRAGEQVLQTMLPRHLILRTSWVFSRWGNNFVKAIVRLARQQPSLAVVADQIGCPTSASSIAEVLWQLVQRYERQEELPWGIHHYSGAPACSWYEFAAEILEQAVNHGLLERKPQLQAITTAEYPTAAARPRFSVLDNQRLMDDCAIPQRDWRRELAILFQGMTRHDF